jgi:hypothetical protein
MHGVRFGLAKLSMFLIFIAFESTVLYVACLFTNTGIRPWLGPQHGTYTPRRTPTHSLTIARFPTLLTTDLQVWIKHDAIPRPSSFDVASSDPFQASHILDIGSPKPGEYYIVIESDASATGPQTLCITAFNSTFSLDTVTPTRLGRNGNVTLHLQGREFRSTMAIALSGGGAVRYAFAAYWFSSTEVWATFSTIELLAGEYTVSALSGGINATLLSTVTVFDGSQVGQVCFVLWSHVEGLLLGVLILSTDSLESVHCNIGDLRRKSVDSQFLKPVLLRGAHVFGL